MQAPVVDLMRNMISSYEELVDSTRSASGRRCSELSEYRRTRTHHRGCLGLGVLECLSFHGLAQFLVLTRFTEHRQAPVG